MLSQGRKHHPCSAGLKDQEKGSTKPAPKATCTNEFKCASDDLQKGSVDLCYGVIGGLMPPIPNFPCKQKRIVLTQEFILF